MSMNFRYPNINGRSEREQIAQIRSFLHQLVDQLNYAIPRLENKKESSADSATDIANQINALSGRISAIEDSLKEGEE